MRAIDNIVIHCTATSQNTKVESILRYWRDALRWKNPGYHFIIEANGTVTQLLDIEKVSNGVKGHNYNSIHISYIGGIDGGGKAIDNRTKEQIIAMDALIKSFHSVYPLAKIKGHRDFEGVKKDCPSFEVSEYIKQLNIN